MAQGGEVSGEGARTRRGRSWAACTNAGAKARALLAELTARAETEYVTPVGLALVHAGLGESDAAFEALERAYELRSLRILPLELYPHWKPLRSDPRYHDLVRRIGLPTDREPDATQGTKADV